MLIEADDDAFSSLIAGAPVAGFQLAQGGLGSVEMLAMLRQMAREVGAHIRPAAWIIVEHGEIVGLCSLKNPPGACGVIEIGYGVAASWRGRGVARRAVGDLLAWARGQKRITAILADTAIDNSASQRVLEHNGFSRIGTRNDPEDGELVCWKWLSGP